MLSHAGHALGARRQFGVRRNPAQLLLALEDALAKLVPAVIEAAFVFVGPLLENVVRAVRRARRPVHEERLVGRESAMPFHPGDRLVGQVFAQMIFRVVRRLDGIEVLIEPRFPLRRFAGEKAVEIIEADALAGRPSRERPHGRGLVRRRVVPFAERGGLVTIFAEHLGERRRCSRDHARIAVPIHGALGDGARPDALMIAPGQQRRARRRTNRSRVEGVVADPLIGDARQRRRMDRAAIGVGKPKAHVIQ